ncbi:RepA protein [Granulicella rosea]|uniref:RepA protein n=1 Tax=Granulicella rosea TaxID=474952 RepID=A0A239MH67_9BACT|nr:replication protein RepA [Granulicella rosea]SNT42011.1 RepA protein [Granulicella rosea]
MKEEKAQPEPALPVKKPRSRAAETRAARDKQALRLGQLVDDRNTGKLGEEVIKIAQAMLLCTLPYSATTERDVVRKARLGDGSTLLVTFSAGINNVPLPFGADRKLLAWVLDRAIKSDSPSIGWESAWEYQKEMGLSRSGKNNKDLRDRFLRISGLNISIQRKDTTSIAGKNFSIIDSYKLPASIQRRNFNPDQQTLLELSASPSAVDTTPYGISLNRSLFDDIRRHHVVVPRSLWSQTKGNSQVQDMVLWLYCRCYAAQTESVIPWASLADQFPQDSNRRRMREHAREAIRLLRHLWPGCRIEAIEPGIWVDRATQPLLLDDPSKGRIRRL